MNVLTIVILAFFAATAFLGYRRGFMRMLLSVISLLAAVILTMLLREPLQNFISENSNVQDHLAEKIYELMMDGGEKAVETGLGNLSTGEGEEEATVSERIRRLELPDFVTSFVEEQISGAEEELKARVYSAAERLAELFFTAVLTLALFFFSWLALTILSIILTKFIHIPELRRMDGMAGLLIALVMAFFVLELFLLSASFMGATSFGQKILSQIQENRILCWLEQNNLVLMFVKKLFS